MSGLQQLLGDFAQRVNTHPVLQPMLAGWSPEFFIQTHEEQTFEVQVQAGRITGVQTTDGEPGDHALLLRGAGEVLERIFTGRLSPLGAYTDGQLEVYGPQKDQIKLDCIALVLWGA